MVHAFFISNTVISNARLKLAKNQEKGKEHSEGELLLLESYRLSSSTWSSKDNKRYSKKCANKVRLFKSGYMINVNEN